MPAHEFGHWASVWRPDAAWNQQSVVALEDVPLLYVCIEHRAWIAAVGAHLRGERLAPPPLDHRQCNFGKWFYEEGTARYGTHAAFSRIHDLHHQVHALAAELMALQAQGLTAQALARLSELDTLRDALIAQLNVLLQAQKCSTENEIPLT
jgi:hypothetical protein